MFSARFVRALASMSLPSCYEETTAHSLVRSCGHQASFDFAQDAGCQRRGRCPSNRLLGAVKSFE